MGYDVCESVRGNHDGASGRHCSMNTNWSVTEYRISVHGCEHEWTGGDDTEARTERNLMSQDVIGKMSFVDERAANVLSSLPGMSRAHRYVGGAATKQANNGCRWHRVSQHKRYPVR